MKANKQADVQKSTPVLLIFCALSALFGSGAIIGITILSNPALERLLLEALIPQYLICFAVLFLLIFGYSSIYPPLTYLTLPAAVLACGVRTTFASAPFVNGLAIALIFAALSAAAIAASVWAWHKYPMPLTKPRKALPCVLAVSGIALAAVASLWLFITVVGGRLDSLQSDKTYAGFGQMLYYMQNSGKPFTTLLSGTPQSYFATQPAPLWYLLLPVYALFSHSLHSILAVGIALYALMLSAVIPLWRICRRLALSPLQSAALCIALVACPLLIGGSSSGGAISMLSLPLMLWIADTLSGKRPYLALIPLILSLGIGFETSVWVVFFCLYLALSAAPQSKRAALVCTAVSAVGTLATGIYLAAVQSPVLANLFSGIGLQIGQKLLFLLLLLLPCALLPLLTKQKAALVLLIPFVLFHLVADANAFSGVFCTYAYPAIAAVFLLSAHGLANLKAEIKGINLAKVLPAVALCASILLAAPYASTLVNLYASPTEEEQADTECMHELLAMLPQNASVTASDSLLCALHDRTWLFSLDADPASPDSNVIVLDLREEFIPSGMEPYDVAYYQSMGYTLREDMSREGILAVLFK
ncbi:MAG: DUF2079 domain-containing protein [Clostridia bacterium]|nr:DUF2079 domain-containing protein [Clostridia bacterium]